MHRLSAQTLIVAVAIGALPGCGGSQSADTESHPEESAKTATLSWLRLLDERKYAESWNTAGDRFTSSTTEDAWYERLATVRDPLGKLVTRQLQSAVTQTEMAGDVAGESVLVKFGTAFENNDSMFEMVTSRLEADQVWRVSSYFIR